MAGNTASGSFASYTTSSGRAVFGIGSTVRSACDSVARTPEGMENVIAAAASIRRPKDAKHHTAEKPVVSRSIPESPLYFIPCIY